MKNKLLILSIATILAAPVAFAADTASDTQTVTVTVPEVDLLDVGSEGAAPDTITLTLTAPTEAGNGFSSTTGSSTYKISANNAADGSGKNKITVAASGGTVPDGATLSISTTALGGGTPTSVNLTNSTTSGTLMTDIGNVASSTGVLNYSFGPTTSGGMVGYTSSATNITLTYTLEDV